MAYDATKMADWQISEEAEKNMPMPEECVITSYSIHYTKLYELRASSKSCVPGPSMVMVCSSRRSRRPAAMAQVGGFVAGPCCGYPVTACL